MPSDFAALTEAEEKKWAGRPLYELQIELCEKAIRQMPSIKATERLHGGDYASPSHVFTNEQKSQFVAAVKKQIEELKSTKKAVAAHYIVLNTFLAVDLGSFNAERAKRMRETKEQEKAELRKKGKSK